MESGFDTRGFSVRPAAGVDLLKDWAAFASVGAYLGAAYGYLLLRRKLPAPPMALPKLMTSVTLSAVRGRLGAKEGGLEVYAAAGGHAYYARGPLVTTDLEGLSRLELSEDERPLGPGHAPHQEIRLLGAGRFSHWDWHLERDERGLPRLYTKVMFSTSDNSDPRVNGRRYTYVFR